MGASCQELWWDLGNSWVLATWVDVCDGLAGAIASSSQISSGEPPLFFTKTKERLSSWLLYLVNIRSQETSHIAILILHLLTVAALPPWGGWPAACLWSSLHVGTTLCYTKGDPQLNDVNLVTLMRMEPPPPETGHSLLFSVLLFSSVGMSTLTPGLPTHTCCGLTCGGSLCLWWTIWHHHGTWHIDCCLLIPQLL